MTTKNKWELWHDTAWTEFELHSAVFGHLRKNLYPDYLVRGCYVFITAEGKQYRPDIAIFKRTKGKPAELQCIVEIKKENGHSSKRINLEQKKNYETLGVPLFYVEGRVGLQLILDQVKPVLK